MWEVPSDLWTARDSSLLPTFPQSAALSTPMCVFPGGWKTSKNEATQYQYLNYSCLIRLWDCSSCHRKRSSLINTSHAAQQTARICNFFLNWKFSERDVRKDFEDIKRYVGLTPRPAGEGGGWCTLLLKLFGDSVKTAARSAAKFGIAYGATFLHMSWKF